MKITLPDITQGPWKYRLDCQQVGSHRHKIKWRESNSFIAEVVPYPLSLLNVDTENEKDMAECAAMGTANAKAISALPDLLAALVDAAEMLDYLFPKLRWNNEHQETEESLNKIKAALTKAGCTITP